MSTERSALRTHYLRELLGAFGYRGKAIPGFLSAARRYRDTSQIQHFGELVDYVQRNKPHLVGASGGEPVGDGDAPKHPLGPAKAGFGADPVPPR